MREAGLGRGGGEQWAGRIYLVSDLPGLVDVRRQRGVGSRFPWMFVE